MHLELQTQHSSTYRVKPIGVVLVGNSVFRDVGQLETRLLFRIRWTLISSADQLWPSWWQVSCKPQKKIITPFPSRKVSTENIVLEYTASLSSNGTTENQNNRLLRYGRAPCNTNKITSSSLGLPCFLINFCHWLKTMNTQCNLKLIRVHSLESEMLNYYWSNLWDDEDGTREGSIN